MRDGVVNWIGGLNIRNARVVKEVGLGMGNNQTWLTQTKIVDVAILHRDKIIRAPPTLLKRRNPLS